MRPIDAYFLEKEEPVKECLLFLRNYILKYDPLITELWHYQTPSYFYNGKKFGYLWADKKRRQPYLGIFNRVGIEHPLLVDEGRTHVKIFLINSENDYPVEAIDEILNAVATSYKN